MRAWRHRRSRRSGGCPRPECYLGTAGSLSCQVETPLQVFLYSRRTNYLRFRPAAVLQCTACGRVRPEQHHRPVGCSWPMRAHPTTGARTTSGWVEDRVREGTHAS